MDYKGKRESIILTWKKQVPKSDIVPARAECDIDKNLKGLQFSVTLFAIIIFNT